MRNGQKIYVTLEDEQEHEHVQTIKRMAISGGIGIWTGPRQRSLENKNGSHQKRTGTRHYRTLQFC